MKSLFVIISFLFLSRTYAQEQGFKKPAFSLFYLPNQLINSDPSICFGTELYAKKRFSTLITYGFSGKGSLFNNPTNRFGAVFKYYFMNFGTKKTAKKYIALDTGYKHIVETLNGQDMTNQSKEIIQYKLDVNISTLHLIFGSNYNFPNAPSIDMFLGLGARHLRNFNVNKPKNYHQIDGQGSFRNEGVVTCFSFNAGLNIGLTIFKKKK